MILFTTSRELRICQYCAILERIKLVLGNEHLTKSNAQLEH